MPKEESIKMEGEVIDSMPNAMFIVKLDDTGHEAKCQVCGKMRQFNIRVIVGDKVEVELSPYDLKRGRITRRSK